jgi:ankyrin repeat protein
LIIKVSQQNFLFYLAKITDTELADKLLEKYLDRSYVNYQTSEKITPLMYAAHSNNIYLVRKLIELGAKTASKDDLGKTALHYASVNASNQEPNAFEIVKLLIEANPALPNIKNTDKKGPGNPNYAINDEVRNYIRKRKTGWFTTRKVNTNKAKQAAGTRRRSRKY